MKRLFDSESKVMELLWDREPVSAKELSVVAAEKIGWNKNTTYTILKKLEAKGFIQREEPGFICRSRVSRREVQQAELQSLADRLFAGSKKALFSALLEEETLSADEIAAWRERLGKG